MESSSSSYAYAARVLLILRVNDAARYIMHAIRLETGVLVSRVLCIELLIHSQSADLDLVYQRLSKRYSSFPTYIVIQMTSPFPSV
jgi:hypothetical protein